MVNNTLLHSAGAQLGELRASLDGLRRNGGTASPAAAAATPIGTDLLGQALALLPSLLEYAGLARQLLGSRSGPGARAEVPRAEVQRNMRPGRGRRLRRALMVSLALGGCYLAYRLTRPARQDGRLRA